MGKIRRKSKSMLRKRRKYEDPREEYIYSPDKPTLKELSDSWSEFGRGYTFGHLMKRSAKEKWKKKRSDFWAALRSQVTQEVKQQMATEQANAIIKANERQREIGLRLQNIFLTGTKIDSMEIVQNDGTVKEVQVVRLIDENGNVLRLNPDQLMKAAQQGIEHERASLGMASQTIRVEFAEELAEKHSKIISKYVTEPSILRNISREFMMVVQREFETLETMKKVGE